MQVSTLQNEQTKPANQVHVYVRDFDKLNGSSLSPKQFSWIQFKNNKKKNGESRDLQSNPTN